MHRVFCKLKTPLLGGGFIVEPNLFDRKLAEDLLHIARLEQINKNAFIVEEK
jgi:hypothetical protein